MRQILPLLLLLATATPALADPAIAMHGQPKYQPGFTAPDYANPDAPKGGTLRLAQSGSFDSVNPYTVRGNRATSLNLIHESLMGRSWDEPFSLYGLIAEDVTTAPDRSWVEFRLNPKTHWNDGTAITVDDVMFSYETLREKGRPNHRTYYRKVSKAEIRNSNTIRFTFETSHGIDREMPLIMGLMPVLNKAWWSGRDVTAPTLDVPVTSGPYTLSKVEAGKKLTFTRDPNYWGRDLPFNRGQYNFDTITYDYFRDDDIALEAFKAGSYDLRREYDPLKWRTSYEGLKNTHIIEEPNARTEPLRGFIFNTRRQPLSDIHVREALTYALDFEWMNKALFGNVYRRATSIYPNSELASSGIPEGAELQILERYRKQLKPEIFSETFRLPGSDATGPAGMRENYRHAVELLKKAGYTLQNGMMQKNGQPLRLEILLTDSNDEKVALEYGRSLKRLGIDATIRTVDSAQYQSRMTDFDFDLTINFWSSTLSPGNEQVYYWGSAAADQPGSRNYAGIKDPAIDAIANSLATAITREDLLARAHALDRLIMHGYYVIPLYYLGRDLGAYHPPLTHPRVTPIYGILPEQTWWVDAQPQTR